MSTSDFMSRRVMSILAVVAVGMGAAGCGDSKRRPVVQSAVAATPGGGTTTTSPPITSGPPAPVGSTTAPPTTPTAPTPSTPIHTLVGLSPTLKPTIAKTFAPRYRFNAWHNDGNLEPQNRHEDFFPMSVARFLQEVSSGQTRVMVRGSSRVDPGISEVRPVTYTPVFGNNFFGDYPRDMVGDPPGTAPVYVSVYEEPAGRNQAPDGSGELVVFAEYWLFYPNDRSEADIFNVIPTAGVDITGHRSDWEHTSYKIRLRLGPGATFLDGTVEQGAFYGHSKAHIAVAPELHLVDDAGNPGPGATHPLVYISQGKHASYPQAGEWKDHSTPAWVADHTDFFRGNGVVIDAWQVPLLDLDLPDAAPSEFNPPEFRTLLAASPHPSLPDWTQYMGNWGPDLNVINLPSITIRLGTSATGPKAKTSYNDFHRGHPQWTDTKARSTRLKVYQDLGITIPPATNPMPVRR